jgi:DNA gyrase subunit A
MKDEDAVDETDVNDLDVNPENGTAIDNNETETE